MTGRTEKQVGVISRELAQAIRGCSSTSAGWIEVEARPAALPRVLAFLQANPECAFSHLVDLVVDDDPAREERFMLAYVLRGAEDSGMCRVVAAVPGGALVPSAADIFHGAEWPERLAWERFGIPFDGHPDLRCLTRLRAQVAGMGGLAGRDGKNLSRPCGGAFDMGDGVLMAGPAHRGLSCRVMLQIHLEGEVVRKVVPHLEPAPPGLAEVLGKTPVSAWESAMDGAGTFVRLALAGAVEGLAGADVPEETLRLRMLVAESARILSHLHSLGEMAAALGRDETAARAEGVRDMLLPFILRHENGIIPGGMETAFTPRDAELLGEFCREFPRALSGLEEGASPLLRLRMAGIGVLSAHEALERGFSGPALRACGIACDLRRLRGEYDGLRFAVPAGNGGDCLSRHLVRIAEMRQSAGIISQCLEKIGAGGEPPPPASIPAALPAGRVYAAVEGARGEVGAWLVSQGGDTPPQVRLRRPEFFHLAALPALAAGHMLDDIGVILASLDIGACGVDG